MNLTLRGNPAHAVRDEIRDKLDANKKAMEEIKRLPRSEAEALAIGSAMLASHLKRCGMQSMAAIYWDTSPQPTFPQDPVGLEFAFSSKEELQERLAKQIAARLPKGGIGMAERKARLAEKAAERAALFYEDEVECMELEKAGHTVVRLGDLDPMITRKVWQDASPDKPIDLLPMMQAAANSLSVRVNLRGRGEDGPSVHAPASTE